MARFDFFNQNYSLDEIIDGYTGGSLDNFKGDEEFLNFLISYTLGNNLEGPEANDYKEYAKYDGILSIALLDQYDMLGSSLYKIYEICGKDKFKFIRTCHHIGEYTVKHTFSKEAIETNLKLSNSVDFIDDSIVLSNGTRPKYDYDNPLGFVDPYHLIDEDYTLLQEYDWELERSLRHRINESIKANGDNIEPLAEMLSYKEKERMEKEKVESKRVKEDHTINLNNLYYGKETIDLSVGKLSAHVDTISWFEDTNLQMMNYKIFRSIPTGNYCLLDKDGNIHIPEEILSQGTISVGPNSPIRKVEIASIPHLFETTIQKLEEDPANNEETILNVKGTYEMMQLEEGVSVGNLEGYETIVRTMYENNFGNLFKSDDNQDGYVGEAPVK